MKHTYHVITPLNRWENLRPLVGMLTMQRGYSTESDIYWEVISDMDVPFFPAFKPGWIRNYQCPNNETTFFLRCNYAINWWLNSYPLNPDHRYCIMNDDDGYAPGYFVELDKHEGEVLISSMRRGEHIPVGVQAERAHGTNTLIAQKENMVIGGVGVEQITMSGKILKDVRIPMEISGDGRMIEYVVNTYGAVYCPDAIALFNALEPGRWDVRPF